ncbi:MAG TPA: hypothetical protein VKA48_09915, partial [Gammaproteobacteria bacterium]|nr:hypothetical protein [Gammaproteobacteria bacterium]
PSLALLLLVAALGAAMAVHLDRHTAFRVRGLLAETGAIGSAAVDFYYRYALYPAQLFKGPGEKLVPSYRMASGTRAPALRAVLEGRGFIRHRGPASPDLEVRERGGRLALRYRGRTLEEADAASVEARPARFVDRFESAADPDRILARAVLAGLGLLAPLGLGGLVLSAVRVVRGRKRDPAAPGGDRRTQKVALVAGFAVLVVLLAARSGAGKGVAPGPPEYEVAARLKEGLAGGNRGPAALAAAIAETDSWYLQWNAYLGLLRMGWSPRDGDPSGWHPRPNIQSTPG